MYVSVLYPNFTIKSCIDTDQVLPSEAELRLLASLFRPVKNEMMMNPLEKIGIDIFNFYRILLNYG